MSTALKPPPALRPWRSPPVLTSERSGISLGRVLGLEISLDTSWLLIFALVGFSLFASLASDYPDRSVFVYGFGALVASVLFFASILFHEISHSLVARANGMEVHGITLFFFGGVSTLKNEPRKPADEFQMAIVGPLSSAVLGLAFMGLQAVLPQGSMVQGLTRWLGWINLALAVFNLLPGFPLDGGRIFRSIAWAVTKDLRKATRIASRAGMVIAYALIIWGLLLAFVYHRMINGLWFGFLGWFLLSAAQQSVAQMELSRILGRIRVSDLLRPDCVRVSPTESVRHFVEERILRTGERCYFVSEDGETLLGVVTVHEVKALPREAWWKTPLQDIMVPLERLRSTTPDAPLLEALETMNQSGINQLPVLEGTRFKGLLTREDVLRRLSLHLELGGRKEVPAERV